MKRTFWIVFLLLQLAGCAVAQTKHRPSLKDCPQMERTEILKLSNKALADKLNTYIGCTEIPGDTLSQATYIIRASQLGFEFNSRMMQWMSQRGLFMEFLSGEPTNGGEQK